MRLFFAKIFCLVAVFSILEGPTIVLQSYAWATMLNDRIPEQGVAEAISTTFDGEHPCEHCLSVEKIQETKLTTEEEKDVSPQFQFAGLKLTEVFNSKITAPSPPNSSLNPLENVDQIALPDFQESVPTPPPQFV